MKKIYRIYSNIRFNTTKKHILFNCIDNSYTGCTLSFVPLSDHTDKLCDRFLSEILKEYIKEYRDL